MIDKLDLQFPKECSMTPALQRLVKNARQVDAKHYRDGRDLRPDYPVIVFLSNYQNSHNKLSFQNTSSLPPQTIVSIR
jgi:hypothetical protein